MTPPAADPWSIRAADFPADAPPHAQLQFLVRYAVLAPSSHNTQPWLFRVAGDTLELFADRTRALAVVDPFDRELVMSCGAALATLELAAQRFGLRCALEPFPAAADPDLLARLRFLGRSEPQSSPLFDAIPHRRTNRRAFEPAPVPDEPLRAARAEVLSLDVDLAWFTAPEPKADLAARIAEGDRIQMADPRFRRELAAWIHPRRAAGRDGLSGYAFGMPDLLSPVGALVIRTFDLGAGQAAKDEALALASPALGLFSTDSDAPTAWLATGRALQRVLLTLTAADLSASFLNQPIEVPTLRPQLVEPFALRPHPQLLLRTGRGPTLLPSARRPPEAVLLPS